MLPEVNALRAPLLELGVSHGRPPPLVGVSCPLGTLWSRASPASCLLWSTRRRLYTFTKRANISKPTLRGATPHASNSNQLLQGLNGI